MDLDKDKLIQIIIDRQKFLRSIKADFDNDKMNQYLTYYEGLNDGLSYILNILKKNK